jgi:hypothetical protein
MKSVKHFRELDVYQGPMSLVTQIFELTKGIPIEERYALTDQTVLSLGMRELSRSLEKAALSGSFCFEAERRGNGSRRDSSSYRDSFSTQLYKPGNVPGTR